MTIVEARRIVTKWKSTRTWSSSEAMQEAVAKLVQREVNRAQKRIPINKKETK